LDFAQGCASADLIDFSLLYSSQQGHAATASLIDCSKLSLLFLPLCSSKSDEKLISFDQYVARMKPDQTQIYFITGQDKKVLEKSPFLEKLLKKDYEVPVNVHIKYTTDGDIELHKLVEYVLIKSDCHLG